MKFVVNVDIARAPADAFDKMADARNEIHWNAQVSRSELVSDEPVGAGSRFETVNRGKTYAATITSYDRPGHLVFEVTGAPMDITATFELTSKDSGTALRGVFEMSPKGFMKVVFPLMKPIVRKDLAKQSQSFASFCESS